MLAVVSSGLFEATDNKMNKYGLAVILAVFGAFAIAVPIGLKYSQATLVFGLIAAVSGPVVIHRIPNASLAIGMLVGLSLFASFPLKSSFKLMVS